MVGQRCPTCAMPITKCQISSYSAKMHGKYIMKWWNEHFTLHVLTQERFISVCESNDDPFKWSADATCLSSSSSMAMRWSFILNLSVVPLLSPITIRRLSVLCMHYMRLHHFYTVHNKKNWKSSDNTPSARFFLSKITPPTKGTSVSESVEWKDLPYSVSYKAIALLLHYYNLFCNSHHHRCSFFVIPRILAYKIQKVKSSCVERR